MISRRTFVTRSGVLLGALALPRLAVARPIEEKWRAAREVIASGALGNVRYASAVVAFAGNRAAMRRVPGGNESAPGAACDMLERLRYAIGDQGEFGATSVAHAEPFAMTCRFQSGVTIAIATVRGKAFAPPSIRCDHGTLHIGENRIEIEVGGSWFSAEDLPLARRAF